MSKLMILGAGGHGKVIADIASQTKKWDEIVFLDDNRELEIVEGYKVIGKIQDYLLFKEYYDYAFVAIGNNKFRMALIEALINANIKIPVLIHPFTSVSQSVQLDVGSVVMAGAVLNANTIVGKGCIINTSCSIDHDCILEDGVHISPGVHIGGTVCIGRNAWICIGSSIINNVSIGYNSIVAAGAAVIKDIESDIVVGGVPAKSIKKLRWGE